MKEGILIATGTAGGVIAALLGGFDKGLNILIMFMAIDYISGIIVAAIFKKSPKTESGALNSAIGLKGLAKKIMCLFMVLIANQLDIFSGTTFVRDATIIAFISNELISIVENAGIMGIPIPMVITKAIDVLNKKEEAGGAK